MKKILFMSGHSRRAFKWGEIGEVVKRLLDNPDYELYYLDCAGQAPGYCGLNKGKHWGYCKICAPVCLKVIKYAGLEDSHIFKMKKYKAPKWPDFKTIKEIIDYNYEGYNYGLGPASCVMTMTRDYNFDVKKWNKHIHKFFNTEYMVFKNIEELDKIYNFDEFHTFNGRMPLIYPMVSYARKNNKPFTTYEQGANINKMRIMKNYVPHDYEPRKIEVRDYWNDNTPMEEKIKLAQKWYDDRRCGKFQAMPSFTKDQIKNYLPKGFDEAKENIVFFNSSIDEVMAYDSWKHPFADTENEIIEGILEYFKDDDTKHFYIRIHPNLARAKKKKATQIRELDAFKKKYKNLTIIEPDEKIDTYALIDAVDKVVTAWSTAGCEATYWGKVSILAGKSPYDELDCVYQTNSIEETIDLIKRKDLKPKPKENTYAYGYRNQVLGVDNKYWNSITHDDGYFMDMHLFDKK